MRIAVPLALVTATAIGCAGPALMVNGRATYNAVINRTEDEQILTMVVRQRYDETYGLLAVASVTASLRVGASVGANVAVGPREDYIGNLVPLSAGAVYEENPTISYLPLRGEEFVGRLLAPLSAEQTLLLARMSTDQVDALPLLVRRVNGLTNPLFASTPPGPAFDRFAERYATLREQGVLDIVGGEGGRYELLIHDCSREQAEQASEWLELLGIQRSVAPRTELAVPLRFFVGAERAGGIDLETPSALEVIEAAGLGIEVPEQDLQEGVVRAAGVGATQNFLVVHSSSSRPDDAAIAIPHRGSWFYIDARDARSKQTFMILRTLIGLRLDDASGGQAAPTLTLPVGGR